MGYYPKQSEVVMSSQELCWKLVLFAGIRFVSCIPSRLCGAEMG